SKTPDSICKNVFLQTQYTENVHKKQLAQNVTWKSGNFEMVLTWEPEPSAHYSYTVEFSQVGRDCQKNPHCFCSSKTQCDLSSSLTDLSVCYTADILSKLPLDMASALTEFPHTRPDFKLHVSKDKKKTTLYVSDPLTTELTDLDRGDSYCFQVQAFIHSRRLNFCMNLMASGTMYSGVCN
uniref:Fibronectin type-III domain-containing protein n=1 Tax=Sphaeramia orbicularis TaxID=375764 RepID=A0A672Y9V0_9TELE